MKNMCIPVLLFALIMSFDLAEVRSEVMGGGAAVPSASGLSETPWVMPPDVEAMFAEGEPFSEKLWEYYTEKSKIIDPDTYNVRNHVEFVEGKYEGVCYDYHVNVELYGGFYKYGCVSSPVNDNHPHKNRFGIVKWNELDPRENVAVIRQRFVLPRVAYSSRDKQIDPLFTWKKGALVFKEMIDDGMIILQCADLEVVAGEISIKVYRISMLNQDSCLAPDGKIRNNWSYFTIDESVLKDDFNRLVLPMLFDVIMYNDKIYFVGDSGVYKWVNLGGPRGEPSRGEPVCRFVSVCVFDNK